MAGKDANQTVYMQLRSTPAGFLERQRNPVLSSIIRENTRATDKILYSNGSLIFDGLFLEAAIEDTGIEFIEWQRFASRAQPKLESVQPVLGLQTGGYVFLGHV